MKITEENINELFIEFCDMDANDEFCLYKESFKEAITKALILSGVSQQRELLIDFMNKTQGKLIWGWDIGGGEKLADEYLKGNL